MTVLSEHARKYAPAFVGCPTCFWGHTAFSAAVRCAHGQSVQTAQTLPGNVAKIKDLRHSFSGIGGRRKGRSGRPRREAA